MAAAIAGSLSRAMPRLISAIDTDDRMTASPPSDRSHSSIFRRRLWCGPAINSLRTSVSSRYGATGSVLALGIPHGLQPRLGLLFIQAGIEVSQMLCQARPGSDEQLLGNQHKFCAVAALDLLNLSGRCLVEKLSEIGPGLRSGPDLGHGNAPKRPSKRTIYTYNTFLCLV